MRAVYQIIEAVAPSNASVLIFGESGTGKELVARAVHSKSERAKGPFFALNCAALPKDILENELFGHEKGAFTGSVNEKPGAFEMADGGTIFLDEVAEMPPDIQVKLLRAIESRSIRRLGGKKEIEVDIRILAATNRDLQKALADNDLREDLYYRLAVVELFLPPLRERIGDIKLLANEFLVRFAEQNGKTVTGFDDAAWEWILSYNWPGNVRELKNAVERAVIMSRGDKIKAADIMPRHLRRTGEFQTPITLAPGATLAETRRQLVLRAFASTNGDYARTATMVGMTPADVRAEIASLLNGNAGEHQSAGGLQHRRGDAAADALADEGGGDAAVFERAGEAEGVDHGDVLRAVGLSELVVLLEGKGHALREQDGTGGGDEDRGEESLHDISFWCSERRRPGGWPGGVPPPVMAQARRLRASRRGRRRSTSLLDTRM